MNHYYRRHCSRVSERREILFCCLFSDPTIVGLTIFFLDFCGLGCVALGYDGVRWCSVIFILRSHVFSNPIQRNIIWLIANTLVHAWCIIQAIVSHKSARMLLMCLLCASPQLEKEALKSAGGASKAVAREARREAEVLAGRLLAKCAESKRDLAAISADVALLRSRTGALKPSLSSDLGKDWRLVFASDDDAISVVGTGLHKLPLTRMQVRWECPRYSY